MENRKFIILIGLFLSLTFYSQAFAYGVGTHKFLTKETLDFYNAHFPGNKISEEFEKYIIAGSEDEDDGIRFMNHFYDPVYNRGLTVTGHWLSSKEWARNNGYQISALYNPVLNTTIAGLLILANSPLLKETDFTWERVISDYVKGDRERAFKGLGHILHLIEDASVPDHTRNDPHPAFNHKDALETGSPYENWTANFTLENPDKDLSRRLRGKSPFILENLGSYFDALAIYSNNNFYSKDTIGIREYKLPEPDYFIRYGSYTYGFKMDKEFGDYHLLAYISLPTKYGWAIQNKDNLILKELKGGLFILSDYWSRLSVKSVQYGAGVVDLFFREAEKAKNDSNFVREEPKSFLAEVADAIQGFVSKISGSKNAAGKLAATIVLDKREINPNESVSGDTAISKIKNAVQESKGTVIARLADIQVENSAETAVEAIESANVIAMPQSTAPPVGQTPVFPMSSNFALQPIGVVIPPPILSAQPGSNARQCSYKTDQSLTHRDLIINEIAWMGGPISANNEWIELKNISGNELDISGWQLLDQGEQIKITFPKNTKIAVGGIALLERTDDDSIPIITADLIYVGALSNTGEGLRLFDKDCNLTDEVAASPEWPAGNADSRKTMERQPDLSWSTYSGGGTNLGGVLIMGTPKRENSQLVVSAPQQPSENNLASTSTSAIETATVAAGKANHVIISEVQVTGGIGQTNNDFIELYNPADIAFNLKGYRLVKRTKTGTNDTFIKSWTQDAFIPAKGFYLWANSNYASIDVLPDATTTATIANDNGIALREGDEDTGIIIDSMAWGEAQNVFIEGGRFGINPSANQSLERKAWENSCVSAVGRGEFLGNACDTNNNQNDFEVRGAPKPQNSRSFLEPRGAPTVSNFDANYSSTTLELVLTWDESHDDSGATSSIEYLLSRATSSVVELKDLAILNATTSYRFRTDEVGLTELFSITAKDKEGLVSDAATTNIAIPSIFREVYFYSDPRKVSQTGQASTTVIELRYDFYPPIINSYNNGKSYRTIVFYANQNPLTIPEFHFDPPMGGVDLVVQQYGSWGTNIPEALNLNFPVCGSGGNGTALVLADFGLPCSGWGDTPPGTLPLEQLEDKNLIIPLSSYQYPESMPGEGNYLTMAFYGSVNNNNVQKLIAVDRQKYYFENAVPAHQAPIFSGPLTLGFDKNKSRLEVSWPSAVDPDTLDSSLSYEINYSTSANPKDWNWQRPNAFFEGNVLINSAKQAIPGDNLLIGVRTKDDFGDYSRIATAIYAWPEINWLIVQNQINYWIRFGDKPCSGCPEYASLQRLSPEAELKFNIVSLRLKAESFQYPNEVKLSVYPDNGGFPDFGAKIAESKLKDFIPDSDSDFAFSFDQIVTLEQGNDYWLVLTAKNGWWQNAIVTGLDDFYLNGAAGRGPSQDCWQKSDFCQSLEIPYPGKNSDWYFKIGFMKQN